MDPAAFSTQLLFLKQGMFYSAHINEPMLPHSSQSRGDLSPSLSSPLLTSVYLVAQFRNETQEQTSLLS